MLRYRMSSKPRKWGWMVIVLIFALLLFVLANNSGSREAGTLPSDTQAGGIGGALLQFWSDVKAGALNLWAGLTGRDQAGRVDVSLDGQQAQGSGEDYEEEISGDIQVVVSNPQTSESFVPGGAPPQVLIYHTHTHESYTKEDGQDYVEAAKWRTTDNSFNVVRVGEALGQALSSKYGIAVLHDTTDNEYPQLGTSYARSLKAIQKDQVENPGLKILVDLHRDAFNAGINPAAVTINGKSVARIMIVIGTGVGQTGVGFAEKPDWKKNQALAQAITDRLNQFDPQLARRVDVKTGRYNQHVSTGAILIEVGHNQNTLDEALNAVPYLAQAIADALDGMSDAGVLVPVSAGTAPAPSASPAPVPSPSPAAASYTPADMPTPVPSGPEPKVITIEPEKTSPPASIGPQ